MDKSTINHHFSFPNGIYWMILGISPHGWEISELNGRFFEWPRERFWMVNMNLCTHGSLYLIISHYISLYIIIYHFFCFPWLCQITRPAICHIFPKSFLNKKSHPPYGSNTKLPKSSRFFRGFQPI